MRHYGVDPHQALGALVVWARTCDTPVPTIAHTLRRGSLRRRSADRGPTTALHPLARGAAPRQPFGPRTTPDATGPLRCGTRDSALEMSAEDGGMQGRVTHADTRPCTTPPTHTMNHLEGGPVGHEAHPRDD